MNQRWRSGRSSYRPAGEPIRTADYAVAPIEREVARVFVEEHHYSRKFPAERVSHGLFRGRDLVGVAVYSHPSNDRTLSNVFPCPREAAAELGRFVLLDSVPGNGETWFLGRSFDLLRRSDFEGIVSFSDPAERRTVDGQIVKPGHVGTIYQAHNGICLGRAKARTILLLPDGTVFHERALSKIRKLERGWRHCADELIRFGAAPLAGDPREWLLQWAPKLTRSVWHPGNFKYAWGLSRAVRRALPESKPYPKLCDVV